MTGSSKNVFKAKLEIRMPTSLTNKRGLNTSHERDINFSVNW